MMDLIDAGRRPEWKGCGIKCVDIEAIEGEEDRIVRGKWVCGV